MVQSQMVRLEAGIQFRNQQFQSEARIASEGRAQDRMLYEEAYKHAEMYFASTSLNFAHHCRTFLQQEGEHYTRQQESEKEAYQRFKEHEVQKVREAEMSARAATNTEASAFQQRL